MKVRLLSVFVIIFIAFSACTNRKLQLNSGEESLSPQDITETTKKNKDDIKFADDEIFGELYDAYSKIEFLGEFIKSEPLDYPFYLDKFSKLINSEVTFSDKNDNKLLLSEYGEMPTKKDIGKYKL